MLFTQVKIFTGVTEGLSGSSGVTEGLSGSSGVTEGLSGSSGVTEGLSGVVVEEVLVPKMLYKCLFLAKHPS